MFVFIGYLHFDIEKLGIESPGTQRFKSGSSVSSQKIHSFNVLSLLKENFGYCKSVGTG